MFYLRELLPYQALFLQDEELMLTLVRKKRLLKACIGLVSILA
jgi:hypothetical protein